MPADDLTVLVLREIRDDVRGLREETRAFQRQQQAFNEQQQAFNEQQQAFNREALARFEVIETALRDMAEQLVILGRGVKVAIDLRKQDEHRIDDLERRVGEIERRLPS